MKVSIEHEVTPQMIADLMVTAIEGGIGYWAKAVTVIRPDGRVDYSDPQSYTGTWMMKGKDIEDGARWQFTGAEFQARLHLVPQRHLRDWVTENMDADTADVIVQTAAFGEIVYG